jgi:hypothetical protein
MLDLNLEQIRAHQKNIARYWRLLETHLTALERSYIEGRLKEEQASAEVLLRGTVPDRLSARLPRVKERHTTLDMATLLHPADAFAHPMDVVEDRDLTSYEKRAILSSWAADSCASRPSQREAAPTFDDIVDALHLLESDPETAELETADDESPLVGHRDRDKPDTLSTDL